MKKTLATAIALTAALGLSACGSTSTPAAQGAAASPSSSMTPHDSGTSMMPHDSGTTSPEAMAKGRYLSYADYAKDMAMAAKGAHVVLFFHAPWCPDCRATEQSLTTAGVPDGLTVVKVDYDSMTDLKQKYGITQQHTFVAVDAAGMKQQIWTGTKTGADILAKIS